MKNKKLKIEELKVKSFTTMDENLQKNVKGGSGVFCQPQTGKPICELN